MTGIIVKAISGFYYVDIDHKVYECRARGVMRKTGTPVVGDTVDITLSGEGGTVECIRERKNCFIRPPIANVDRLCIVSSYRNPAPNTLMIDKMIGMCEQSGIEPIVIFNKSDMGDFSELESVYRKAGFQVFVMSCASGEGMESVKASLRGICAFTGNSGVGKSTILNHLFPELSLPTGEVSNKLGRGRHTTRHVELFKTETGYVADTPGFSAIETTDIDKEEVIYLFREFADCVGKCQFTSCSHTKEQGCAVIERLKSGHISSERYANYCTLYHEAASIDRWSKK